MKVFTFVATDPECPSQALARIRLEAPRQTKRPAGAMWHPIVFSGATAEDARAKAEAWLGMRDASELVAPLSEAVDEEFIVL